MTLLTVPISAKTVESAIEQIQTAKQSGAEAVELRTDYIEGLKVDTVAGLIKQAKDVGLKLIATCRDKNEGGQNDYPDELRREVLIEAIKAEANYIDCEFENFKKKEFSMALEQALEGSETRLTLSAHNFKKPFKNIRQLYDSILITCPNAIPKIVYKANNINDCFKGFDVLKHKDGDAIVIAMGEDGVITRILAKKFGSLVCFACVDEGSLTAPGQVSVKELKELYRYDSIDRDTELFGIIANPVGHSKSPAIHNACFSKSGMNKVYLPLLLKGDAREFNEFMDNVTKRKWLGFRGFSVSIPHKVNALDHVNQTGGFVEDLAMSIAAVNTLTVGYNERVNAYNTDYAGAMDAIVNEMGITKQELEHKTAAVIGAGGVSRAVVAGLTDVGAKVIIYNRTLSKAKKLAKDFKCHYGGLDELESLDAEIVVNCTSIGMYPEVDRSPVPENVLKENMLVFDTVYNPSETLLLKQAKQAGAKTVAGTEMFINQAIEQFKHFTNQEPDKETMAKQIN